MTRELLQGTKSSAELDAEIAACKTAKERAIAALNDLGKEREAALLSAADSKVDEIEAAIKRQSREIERQGARLRDLEGAVARAVECEQAEAQAASQKCLEAVYAHCAKLQLEEYPKLAAKLRELLLVIDAANEFIKAHRHPGDGVMLPNDARWTPQRRIPGRTLQKIISHQSGAVIVAGAPNDHKPLRYETVQEPDRLEGGGTPRPLVETVTLPGVKSGDPDIWSSYTARAGASYLEILKRAGLRVDVVTAQAAEPPSALPPAHPAATVEVQGEGASVMRDGRRIA